MHSGFTGVGGDNTMQVWGGDIWVEKVGAAVSMAGSPLGPHKWTGLPPREALQ